MRLCGGAFILLLACEPEMSAGPEAPYFGSVLCLKLLIASLGHVWLAKEEQPMLVMPASRICARLLPK